jgi:hypothetical protein
MNVIIAMVLIYLLIGFVVWLIERDGIYLSWRERAFELLTIIPFWPWCLTV